jgi:FkbH-like protein
MKLSYQETQKFVNQLPLGVNPDLNITILRNIMLEPIEPYLRYLANQIQMEAQIHWSYYDTIVQDAVGGNSTLLNDTTDCVLIFAKFEGVSAAISQRFPTLSHDQVTAEVIRIIDYVRAVVHGIRQQTKAMILWVGFEYPINPALGLVDSQISEGQTGTIQQINTAIQSLLQKYENSYFMDLNLSLARIGSSNYFDYRYWHIGRAPYTYLALQDMASEIFKYLRVLKGANKKCLVLDCDNTLWGGVIGEDGLSGIKLSKVSHPGSSFYEFQQEVVNLYHRGILIALCSKNEEADVWNVFRNHPDMLLQESHIACARINWLDKASNLCQIAETLNLGIDSLVFMDDSDFEVNLIRQLVPEVTTVHLPVKRSAEYRQILAGGGWFDTLAFTAEDRARGALYSAEHHRTKIKQTFTSIEDYHRSLEMVAEFAFSDKFSAPRIAQLTQKTNQFNLTTQRYSELDIMTFAESNASDVLYLRLRDKFGDYGIVGVAILIYSDGEATIDSLLISCRVLGRHVEDALLYQILCLAQSQGCTVAWGRYSPTPKNAQVKTFYIERGFVEKSTGQFYQNLTQTINLQKAQFLGETVSQLFVRS